MVMTIVMTISESIMRTVTASEFKAKCLKLMDEVAQTGEEIVITKNGKPVSRLVAHRPPVDTLFGLLRGVVQTGDDVISPVGVEWEAGR